MWQNQKSNYVFKNAGNRPGFTLQTRYLVDIIYFYMILFISIWCDCVLIMVVSLVSQLGKLLRLNDPKLVLQPPNPKVQAIF